MPPDTPPNIHPVPLSPREGQVLYEALTHLYKLRDVVEEDLSDEWRAENCRLRRRADIGDIESASVEVPDAVPPAAEDANRDGVYWTEGEGELPHVRRAIGRALVDGRFADDPDDKVAIERLADAFGVDADHDTPPAAVAEEVGLERVS